MFRFYFDHYAHLPADYVKLDSSAVVASNWHLFLPNTGV